MSSDSNHKNVVLCVDDDTTILSTLQTLLSKKLGSGVTIETAESGQEALEIHDELQEEGQTISVIISDFIMPAMRGDQLLVHMHEKSPKTIKILLTGQSDLDGIRRSINEADLYRFLEKPFDNTDFILTVKAALTTYNQDRALIRTIHDLEMKSLELQRNQDLTILAMGSICETRDNDTGNHIYRTRAFMEILAARLARLPRYHDLAPPIDWQLIWKSAPLHDIGKVGIPDHILLKPGRLTPEEFEVMKRHTTLGYDAIRSAETRLDGNSSFLQVALDIAYCHHERWDGKGYPQGLRGEEIPLSARMMAIADVYDALISKRVYKPAFSHHEAVAIIQADSGSMFDSHIVDCFLEDTEAFNAVASKFRD